MDVFWAYHGGNGVINAILAIVVAPPVILSMFFALEVMMGLRPLASPAKPVTAPMPTSVIVIPAHNEEASIAATVESLRSEAGALATILVVADNCTDRTAEIARGSGARCVVRDNPGARGKGYALAFARDELAKAPPSIVLVVDADCRINRASIAALIDIACARTRPVQAVNLLRPDLGASPFVQMSNFAFLLRNLIRQRGLQRLAARVHLTGTGMALPWSLFAEADLGGGSIVEDLDLGLSMAARGHAPLLVEGATVWSPAASKEGTLQQRERWEGGFIKNGLRSGLRGLGRSIARIDARGFIGAVDLCVPPLALLGMLDVIAMIVAGTAAAFGASAYPLAAALLASACAGVAAMSAWISEGRPYASLGALARLPVYVLRKLPMYVRILTRGAPRDWLRADRSE